MVDIEIILFAIVYEHSHRNRYGKVRGRTVCPVSDQRPTISCILIAVWLWSYGRQHTEAFSTKTALQSRHQQRLLLLL